MDNTTHSRENTFLELVENLRRINEDGSGMLSDAEKELAGYFRNQGEIARKLVEWLGASADEKLDRNCDQLRDATLRLASLGWTFPLNLTQEQILEVADPSNSEGAVESWFVGFYSKSNGVELQRITNELGSAPSLQLWHPLLSQAAVAFHEGLYLTVIPSLLSIIEGTITSEGGTLHATTVNVRRFAGSCVARTSDRTFGMLGWLSVATFVDELFGPASFASPRPPDLNRHWVLHGRDNPSNWTNADAMRLFHALYTLEG